MLFDDEDRRAVHEGRITVAFPPLAPTDRQGGRHADHRDGVLAIDEVDVIDPQDVTDADAHAAGRADAAAVLAQPGLRRDGELHRIRFHRAGDDPRLALRERSTLTPQELDELHARLERFDRSSRHGVWTRATLELIADSPGVRAADLAARMPEPSETQVFKTDVRKLKGLGLTESLEVGYRLSPRGAALLDRLRG